MIAQPASASHCHVLEDPHPSLRRHSVQLIVRRQRVLIAAHNVLRPGVVGAEVGDAEIHLDPEPVLALGLLRRESLRKLHLGWLLLVEMRSRLGGRMGVVCVLLTEAVCMSDKLNAASSFTTAESIEEVALTQPPACGCSSNGPVDAGNVT